MDINNTKAVAEVPVVNAAPENNVPNVNVPADAPADNDAKPDPKADNKLVVLDVISSAHGDNVALEIEYNGRLCLTPKHRLEALRNHYKLSALRKYGINPRDEQGEPLKNNLIINGQIVRAKLPAITCDANGAATENLEQYYNRTRNKASGAYSTVIKGLERIDFVSEMM